MKPHGLAARLKSEAWLFLPLIMLGVSAPAWGAPPLRPALFGPLPPWLAGSTAGLTQPHDLSDAGQKTIDATVFPDLKTFANGGRAAQVVVTSLPFTATANNTEYILQSDLTSTGAGIIIKGNLANWTVNLNGHTLTFGTGTPVTAREDCFGVGSLAADRYNISGGQIVNGRIVYGGGPGANARDSYGEGYNPIMFHSGGPAFIGGLYLVGAADHSTLLSGYYMANCTIAYNTFDDQSATIVNRMAPPCQIRCSSGNNIRWNRVLHARQFGFQIGSGTVVEFNEIVLDGLDTNSQCIGGYGVNNCVVRGNNLYGLGAMPTGLGLGGGSGATNWLVASNWFEGLYTRQALRTAGDLDDYQNHAVGLSLRWGVHTGNRIVQNTLICYAKSQSVVGSAGTWDATGKAVFYENDTATADNLFSSNVFAAVSLDGVARSLHDDYTPVRELGAMTAVAVGPSGTAAGGVVFSGNRIVSDICPLGLPDAYVGILGPAPGGLRMLFEGNSIERLGAVPGFALISYGGYNGRACAVDFIGNTYSNVAEDSAWDIDPANAPGTDLRYRYGYWLAIACSSGGVPVAGASVTVTDAAGILLDTRITDASGACRLRGLVTLHNATTTVPLTPLRIEATWAALSASLSVTPVSNTAYALNLAPEAPGKTDLPLFTGLAVSGVGSNAAGLIGTVTGAPPLAVSAFWGEADGGTSETGWACSTNAGIVEPGSVFAVSLDGLRSRAMYYYRGRAGNGSGTVWSAAGAVFWTTGGETDLNWTNRAVSGSWTATGSWDRVPLFDGTENAFVGAAATNASVYALDGDRAVNSLSLFGNKTISLAAGTPASSRLVLRSGSLARASSGGYAYFTTASVQIDDGVHPVSALWSNGVVGAGSLALQAGSRLYGLPASSILYTGPLTLLLQADNSTNFGSRWCVSNGVIQVDHPGGFGSGTVEVRNGGTVTAASSLTLSNALFFGGGRAGFSLPNSNTLTLAGEVAGPGVLYAGGSLPNVGAIRLAGTNITASGGIDFFRGCPVVVAGRWTNCGDIVLRSAYNGASLQGSGEIGMAPGKTLTMIYGAGYTNYIAPGNGSAIFGPTNGAVGTLILGTPDNGNSVTFGPGSCYVADVTATNSDRLVVNGRVAFTGTANQLSLYGNLGARTCYTLMEYAASDTGSFARVFLNESLVLNPTNHGGVNGSHTLVYGATRLRLMPEAGPGTVVIVR